MPTTSSDKYDSGALAKPISGRKWRASDAHPLEVFDVKKRIISNPKPKQHERLEEETPNFPTRREGDAG